MMGKITELVFGLHDFFDVCRDIQIFELPSRFSRWMRAPKYPESHIIQVQETTRKHRFRRWRPTPGNRRQMCAKCLSHQKKRDTRRRCCKFETNGGRSASSGGPKRPRRLSATRLLLRGATLVDADGERRAKVLPCLPMALSR
ncbi:hypothetical protein [Burkholderia gladioli]|uniref:hypothetical protein n=1 Tax=Burkholderia gladioli TaxID=28095 RepID=UPI0011876E1A|nr:hypothetical protein [Burkholderia gladioli]MDJ1165560.1 hypothetical protein [Burkholderia gladioli pv. gladioli]